MSTLRVSSVRNASSATGGLDIAADGVVSGALPSPNRNLLYNGAMQVAQRGTSTTGITTTGWYTADRWLHLNGTAGTWTQTVENDAPTGSGLRKSLKMLCTTAKAVPDATTLGTISQRIEGQDVQRIAKGTASARPITLSFWVKSNVTGTYALYVSGADGVTISYAAATYTISTSGTWERKTITFPADTTGNTIANDNQIGCVVNFGLIAGSVYTSTGIASTWTTATTGILTGQTNVAAATNNYWQVTGVQLEVGDTATPFEFKSYGQELAECQRYYYRHAEGSLRPIGTFSYYNNTYVIGIVQFPVTMRVAPVLNATSGTDHYYMDRNNATDLFNSVTIGQISTNVARLDNQTEVSGTAGQSGVTLLNSATGHVSFSAEL